MNKATGFLLFLLPFTQYFTELKYSCVMVCAIATLSTIEEGHYICTGKAVE